MNEQHSTRHGAQARPCSVQDHARLLSSLSRLLDKVRWTIQAAERCGLAGSDLHKALLAHQAATQALVDGVRPDLSFSAGGGQGGGKQA